MKKWLLIWSLAVLFAACSDEDFHPSILEVEEEELSELDQWIMDNFTKPYNIEILYQWVDFESNQDYNLVPPEEDKVRPFLEVIKTVWVDPYLKVAGDDFFATLCPKQVMLIGSAGYNEDGTYLLGEAAGGNKITMYNLNYDDPKSDNMVLQYVHNFHHEFSHILHQTVEYPESFGLVTADVYTSNWATVSSGWFQSGCISNYAMADADEDFAEMFSYYVHSTEQQWDSYMLAGGEKIQEKETLLLNYMQSVWGVDMDALRAEVLTAIEKVKQEAAEEEAAGESSDN